VVAVFDADASEDEIRAVTSFVRPDVVQMPLPALSPSKKIFSSSLPLWNTIRVGRDDLGGVADRSGDALHFDTSVAGRSGGTG
jgi:phosphoribosylanthranilate isomerase